MEEVCHVCLLTAFNAESLCWPTFVGVFIAFMSPVYFITYQFESGLTESDYVKHFSLDASPLPPFLSRVLLIIFPFFFHYPVVNQLQLKP